MKKSVNLEDVLEAIEMRTNDSNYFYNKNTGEIHYITDDELKKAKNDPEIDDYPEWQQRSIKTAVAINSTSDYLKLPEGDEINDYKIMEDFCHSITDKKLKKKMLESIEGESAFRRFKDKIYEYDLADDWYDYQAERFKQIAVDWCERNDIDYQEKLIL